jgi:cytidylate kinase
METGEDATGQIPEPDHEPHRNRADSPLRPAPDAFLLDSTNLSLEEAVKAAETTVETWLAKQGFTASGR